MKNRCMLLVGLLMGFIALPGASIVVSAEDFYKEKTVTIVVPFLPSGGWNTCARITARHIPKYISGHPPPCGRGNRSNVQNTL